VGRTCLFFLLAVLAGTITLFSSRAQFIQVEKLSEEIPKQPISRVKESQEHCRSTFKWSFIGGREKEGFITDESDSLLDQLTDKAAVSGSTKCQSGLSFSNQYHVTRKILPDGSKDITIDINFIIKDGLLVEQRTRTKTLNLRAGARKISQEFCEVFDTGKQEMLLTGKITYES
jgi:hypothetical protein